MDNYTGKQKMGKERQKRSKKKLQFQKLPSSGLGFGQLPAQKEANERMGN